MQFLKSLVLIFSILLFSFPTFGQEVPPKENAKAQQEPYIAGEWSEPVNGIRMMAKLFCPLTQPNKFKSWFSFKTVGKRKLLSRPLIRNGFWFSKIINWKD